MGQQACAFTTKALNAQNAGAAAVRACAASARTAHTAAPNRTGHRWRSAVLQVLIIDNRDENLITMDAGADDDSQRCARLAMASHLHGRCLTFSALS